MYASINTLIFMQQFTIILALVTIKYNNCTLYISYFVFMAGCLNINLSIHSVENEYQLLATKLVLRNAYKYVFISN